MPKRLKFVVAVSVVYGTTANLAGAAIRNFRIGPSLSNRIKSGHPIRIRIKSRSFAGPYFSDSLSIEDRNLPICKQIIDCTEMTRLIH